ncbi:thiamine pyrophosphate-binding protein [Prauserella flavalba]|uniref:thiamine pyrophosphate-binding protein n=1 Tax=Prauserella flavalba TaxID=1477506 RepID=UPI0036E158DD
MKVHSALAATIADHGGHAVFGVMGDANMFLIDSLVHERQVHYVPAANEAGAVLMGAGYAARSGAVGFATVTYGPGLLNAVGTLVSVVRQRTPLVLITGETPSARPRHSQRIDQSAFAVAAGAGYVRVDEANAAASDLGRTLERAASERRPYVFACPSDFTFHECGPGVAVRTPTATRPVADLDALDRAAGVLATASRPLVLAGHGCVRSDAAGPTARLAEALGAPLMTTLPAKGLFTANEYDLGVCGTFSTPPAVEALRRADCIVAVGTSLNRLTGGGEGWPYFEGKVLVHCDTDPAAILSRHAGDIGVVADAADFASSILAMLEEIGHRPSAFREQCRTEPVNDRPGRGPTSLELATALAVIDEALPSARMVTVDGGRFSAEAITRMRVPDARSWACSFAGFGAVGHAVSTAIGMGCAAPELPSVAVVGDGGFMLGGLSEFNTAVRCGLDLIVVIVNDSSYGAEYRKLQAEGFDTALSTFVWPSFADVAASLGGAGIRVTSRADLGALTAFLEARKTPVVIEVVLDASQIT